MSSRNIHQQPRGLYNVQIKVYQYQSCNMYLVIKNYHSNLLIHRIGHASVFQSENTSVV